MPSNWKGKGETTSKFHEEGSWLFLLRSNDFKAAISAMRGNQCLIRHDDTDESQHVRLTKGSQAVTSTFCLVPFIWNAGLGKTNLEWEKSRVVAACDGRGRGMRELWEGGDVLYLDMALGNRCMQLSKLSKHTLKIHAFHCEILHQEKKTANRSLMIG